jgi:hypothetical protein
MIDTRKISEAWQRRWIAYYSKQPDIHDSFRAGYLSGRMFARKKIAENPVTKNNKQSTPCCNCKQGKWMCHTCSFNYKSNLLTE